MTDIIQIPSIAEAHRLLGIEKPKHPLVSIFRHQDPIPQEFDDIRITGELYFIAMKEGIEGSFAYGRGTYDFDEGTMVFTAPGQVLTPVKHEVKESAIGWTILVHPDLFQGLPLASTIENYSFFDYEVNEALHLSDREKQNLTELVHKIESEIDQNIDKHSQKLIVANIELLLDYCTRYYDRQFYTRTNVNKEITSRFNGFLKDYFNAQEQLNHGIPTVKRCAEELHLSANYLSDLLKKETGRNAQDHIHQFVIDKAKIVLLNSTVSISQVAFQLGFEYSQHFSTLFKAKTGMTPKAFRNLDTH